MSQIDFIIGFILIISALFLIINFISNSISNNVSEYSIIEIEESSLSLEKYLFKINDDKSLISTVKQLQAFLIETNGTDHTEEIRILINPQISKVRVYNITMSEIPSIYSQSSGELYFDQYFNAYQEIRVNIFYFGDPIKNIDYISTDNNISLRILSDKKINIVSQEKCSNLRNRDYEDTKNIFGFQNQFRLYLDSCNYGLEPPLTSNVILKNIPIFFESSNGLLNAEIARLRIW
jgi:hypothetical protein